MKKKGILVIIGIVIIAILIAIFALTRPTSIEKIMKDNNISTSGKYAVLEIGYTKTTEDEMQYCVIEQKGSAYKDMMKAIKKADLKKVSSQPAGQVKKGAFMLDIRESKDSDQGIRFFINNENEVYFDTKLYKVKNDVELYDAIEKAYKKCVVKKSQKFELK